MSEYSETTPLIPVEIEKSIKDNESPKNDSNGYNFRNFLSSTSFVMVTLLVVGSIVMYALSPLAQMRSSSPQCSVNHSFQESASQAIPVIFSSFSPDNRLSLAALYAKLGIYSFAYFPLQSEHKITYATWEFDKRKLGETAPPPTTWVTTNDPVEVVLYYANSLHVVQGDLDDAKTGTDDLKIENIAVLAKNLHDAMIDTLSSNISVLLSWERYMSYPGPFGRVWADGTTVTWSLPVSHGGSHQDLSRILFLPVNANNKKNANYNQNRRIDNQLWGSKYPRDGDSVGEAFARLVQSQVANTKKRYKRLLKLDPTGAKKHWASKEVLLQPSNIVTFHKVRKIIRTVSVTIETFPEMISAFYRPVPKNVIAFVNKNFNENLDPSLPLFYGDIFCYSGFYRFGSASSRPASASVAATTGSNAVKCSNPIYSISALLFIADKHSRTLLSPSFFGLSETDLNSIRGVMLMQGPKLGQHVFVSNSIGCPSGHASFKKMKKGSPINLYDSVLDAWHKPALCQDPQDSSKYVINGTICEFDHYFGHVHDLLIRIEQSSPIVNASYEDYTLQIAQGLESFTRDSNVNKVVDDVLAGLC